MTKAHNIASFVLRFTQELWQDSQGEPHVRWRGHIRHVQGNDEDHFTDFAEAVAFMQRHLTQLTAETLASGEEETNHERVFLESFKLWEQFAFSYTDMMSKAIEQSVKQSEAFKARVDEIKEQALKAWFFHNQPEPKEVLEAIGELQEKVQTLTEKVSQLEESLRHPDANA